MLVVRNYRIEKSANLEYPPNMLSFQNLRFSVFFIAVADTRFDSILFVDPVRRINTNDSATTSCTECTPLLGRRPVRNGYRINFALLSLGIILIGGVSVGSYLLAMDSTITVFKFPIIQHLNSFRYSIDREIPVKLVFDMVERIVWDSNGFPATPHLISSHVRNIYIMQTNGFDCHNYAECVVIIQNMQVTLTCYAPLRSSD